MKLTQTAADVNATVSPSVDVEKTNLEANVSKQSLVQKGFFDDFFLRHFFIDRRKEQLPPRYANEGVQWGLGHWERSIRRKACLCCIFDRSPSVNLGYYARHVAMQFTLERRLINMESEGCDYQVNGLRLEKSCTSS